jgi:hypothetical protein
MKNPAGIILIIIALLLGYAGFVRLDDSQQAVNFLGIFKFTAEDEGARETAYILFAAAALCLVGGITVMNKK